MQGPSKKELVRALQQTRQALAQKQAELNHRNMLLAVALERAGGEMRVSPADVEKLPKDGRIDFVNDGEDLVVTSREATDEEKNAALEAQKQKRVSRIHTPPQRRLIIPN